MTKFSKGLIGILAAVCIPLTVTGCQDAFAGTYSQVEDAAEEQSLNTLTITDADGNVVYQEVKETVEAAVVSEAESVYVEDAADEQTLSQDIVSNDTDSFIMPVKGASASEVVTVFDNGTKVDGVSIPCDVGSEIVAVKDGVVELAEWYYGCGRTVIISHSDGTKTLYGHCDSINVSVGDEVVKGDCIALSGSSGSAVVPALLFKVIENDSVIDGCEYVFE